MQNKARRRTSEPIKTVFLIHGRDLGCMANLRDLLKTAGLEVLTFEDVESRLSEGAPFIGKVVEEGVEKRFVIQKKRDMLTGREYKVDRRRRRSPGGVEQTQRQDRGDPERQGEHRHSARPIASSSSSSRSAIRRASPSSS